MLAARTSTRFLLGSALIHVAALAGWHVDITRPPTVRSGGTLQVLLPAEQTRSDQKADAVAGQPAGRRQLPAAQTQVAKPQPATMPVETASKDRMAQQRPAPRTPVTDTRPLSGLAATGPAPDATAVSQQPSVPAHADKQASPGSALQLVLETRLARYFSYPRLAQRRNWQGEVRLGLRVESNGHLSHIRVIKSSGYAILDEAALASLRQVETVPHAGHWLQGKTFDTVLPIKYRLLDS
jgi:protein TonB